MKYLLIVWAVIIISCLLYFGIDEPNSDFFEKGNGIAAEYRIIYEKQVYHLGEMVHHNAMLATVIPIFMAI